MPFPNNALKTTILTLVNCYKKLKSVSETERMGFLYFFIGFPPAIYFVIDPTLDLWGAQLGHKVGFGYPAAYTPSWMSLRRAIQFSAALLPIGIIYSFLSRAITGKHKFKLDGKAACYLLLCMIIGPWLLANEILKDNWGRPRPAHLDVTIGTKQYAPPLIINDQCEKNCSFISGEASFGYIWVSLAFIPGFARRKRRLFVLGIIIGSSAGFMRIIQGGHFISDVWYAALFMIGTAWVLAWVFYKTTFIDCVFPLVRNISAYSSNIVRRSTVLLVQTATRLWETFRGDNR
tara:strand:+ start:3023 stop:3892 length:870 start_codon:yes stop_codon:yes gene_type:complete